jgi:SAM-dependent methyltransferase
VGFDNRAFWNERYASAPDLGSGLGSRGSLLEKKQRLISDVVEQIQPVSMLDIGCGDIEVTRHLPVKNYTGVDLSENALNLARQKRPDWSFVPYPHADADLVISMDVLIHQPSRDDYVALCGLIRQHALRHVLVAAYNQPPWFTSEITFYYEPISRTLLDAGLTNLQIVSGYRDVTVVLAQV